jgi:hypothetical protein
MGLIYFTQVYTAMELAANLWPCFKYIIPGDLFTIPGASRSLSWAPIISGPKGQNEIPTPPYTHT